MRRRRRASKLAAATLCAALLSTPAGASPLRQTGAVSRGAGPSWLAVTLDVPAGAAYGWAATWTAGGEWSATGCFEDAGDDKQLGAGYWLHVAHQTYAHASAHSPAGGTLAAGAAPNDRPAQTTTFNCRSTTINRGSRTIVQSLVFIAADGAIGRSIIRRTDGKGVRVLAEASGTAATLQREDSFGLGDSARGWAGYNGTGCGAAGLKASATRAFTRHATALLETGGVEPSLPVGIGPSGSTAPALLSVTGPAQPTGLSVGETSYTISSVSLSGPHGSYGFGVAAMVSAECSDAAAARQAFGKSRYVILAAADADFPPCSTRPVKVVARGHGGHPICR